MEDMNAFERQVTNGLGVMGGPGRRIDAMAMVRTASTQSPKWRFPSMFSATKLVVAGVIVALFGGFLLAGVLTQERNDDSVPVVGASAPPDSSSLAPVKLPSELPEGTRWGTLETPLGPARWVHLQRRGSNLPEFNEGGGATGIVRTVDHDQIIATANGFATLDERELEGLHVLWRSPDLVTWTPHQVPVSAWSMDLSWTGGWFWVATSDPASLWRTTDGADWQEVDLSAIEPPDVPGLDWKMMVGTPVSSLGITLVPIGYSAQGTTEYLGLPPEPKWDDWAAIRASGPGTYTAHGEYDYPLAELRFEEIEGGLRVIDAEDGTAYAELDGVDMDFIEYWAAQGHGFSLPALVATRLGIIDGSAVVPADQPQSPFMAATFLGGDEGLVAYQTSAPDSLIHVWRSVDGSTWTEDQPLGDDAGEPISGEQVRIDFGPDRIEVIDYEDDRGWTSTDGLTWSAYEGITWTQDDYDRGYEGPDTPMPPGIEDAEFTRIPQGFLYLSAEGSWDQDVDSAPVHNLVFHLDEQYESVVVDVSDLEIGLPIAGTPDEGWALHAGFDAISANTVMLNDHGELLPLSDLSSENGGIWVITFDDPPG